jgi:hypothetical protein
MRLHVEAILEEHCSERRHFSWSDGETLDERRVDRRSRWGQDLDVDGKSLST